MLVFLKTSEEAKCATGTACEFTWISALPTVTGVSTNFDTSLNEYTISISGTGFTGTTSTTQLYLDETLLSITSLTPTSLTATVTSISDVSSTDLKLYFPEGIPEGNDLIAAGVTFTPQLVSVSPNVGSPAGSVITATVKGVGVDTTGLKLYYGSTELCSSITIVDYGKIQCVTKAVAINSATAVTVKLGSTSYQCVNSDTTQCQYSTSASMPAVSAASIVSGQYISLTGTNFFTSGYTAKVRYAGVYADSVSIDSATGVVASFTKGVPFQGIAVKPELSFVKPSGETHFASVTATLSNLPPTLTTAATTCSFAGGCQLTLNTQGLSSTLSNSTRARINVCGATCAYSAAVSTISATKCLLPALNT